MNTIVGNKIKTLRKKKGLSQEQVADYLHISQSTYARIENGERGSWANYIEPISKLFNVQLEELLIQDKVIINNNQQGGTSNNAMVINQELTNKLITQYEARLKEKDKLINFLEQALAKLKK